MKYQCANCDLQFTTINKLHGHAGRVHGIALFECVHCKSAFKRSDQLKRHLTIHSDERPFACDQCSHRFRLLNQLIEHENQSHTLDIQTAHLSRCKLCGSRYADLNDHLASHHQDVAASLLECDICKEKFRTRYHISLHMQTHINDRQFRCTQCPQSFNFKSQLHLHARIHSDLRPYQCESCGKSFKIPTLLKTHLRMHTGERPFKCSLCPNAYAVMKSLRLHMRIHSGETPYKCPVCERGFHDGSTMKVHMRQHTGESPYACHLCDKRTKQPNNLISHYRHFHKITDITSRVVRENARRIAAELAATTTTAADKFDVTKLYDLNSAYVGRKKLTPTIVSLPAGTCLNAPSLIKTETKIEAQSPLEMDTISERPNNNLSSIIPNNSDKLNIEFVNIKEEDEDVENGADDDVAAATTVDLIMDELEIHVDFQDDKTTSTLRNDDFQKPIVYLTETSPPSGAASSSVALEKIDGVIDEVKRKRKTVNNNKTKYLKRSGECEVCKKYFVHLERHQAVRHNGDVTASGRPFACDHPGCVKAFKLRRHLQQHQTFHTKRNFICENCGAACYLAQDLRRHMISRNCKKVQTSVIG